MTKRYLKDINTEILKINNRNIVINFNNWNGEKYFNCFEVAENLIDIIKKNIEVKPIYKQVSYGDFELTGYEIVSE